MPWTLYRYILREIIKLMVISTTVLVVGISFAAAIKPLSDGLLGPVSLLKFVLFTAPTMLQFALPLAGAFASTLVFCRMTADNEIIACSSAGMSYRAILLPVLGLGLVLTLGLFYLSGWVVPRFYVAAERVVRKDMVKLIVNQVNRREPVDMTHGILLYADTAAEQPPPTLPDSRIQPTDRLVLSGVAVTIRDKEGKLQQDGSAQIADVLFFGGAELGNQTWVTIHLGNVMSYDPERDELIATEKMRFPAWRIPSLVKEDPRFLSMEALRELGANPDRHHKVQEAKWELAAAIAGTRVRQEIERALAAGQAVTLAGFGTERYVVRAPRLQRQGEGLVLEAAAGRPVTVEYQSGTRRAEAKKAIMQIAAVQPDPEPCVAIKLSEVRVRELGEGSSRVSDKRDLALPRARWPGLDMADLSRQDSQHLLAEARRVSGSRAVEAAAGTLNEQRIELLRRIMGQLHSRSAAAINCLLVLLLGATLSLKMRGTMPLVVYLFAFLVAFVSVIIVQAGRTMLNRLDVSDWVGLAILWSATAVLLAVIGGVYGRLARN